MPQDLSATYFDGRSARAHSVKLDIGGGFATIRGASVDLRVPLAALKIGEVFGRAPRRIELPGGAYCEVPARDHAALAALLEANGVRASHAVEKMQRSWSWVFAAVAVTIVFVIAGYRWGVPWIAAVVAERIPHSVAERLSEDAVKSMDDSGLFKPSKLPDARQDAIRATFDEWRVPEGDRVAHKIVFRDSRIGANALALPSGLIVVTDDLAKLTDDDKLIAAVLAHELGHVKEKHGLRQAVQASIVGLVLAWWFGDVSSLLATIPALLLQSSYSRELETAADDYAARMLKTNGLSPALLADILEKLEAAHAPAPKEDPQDGTQSRGKASPLDYLSSHPATRARLARLRTM